MHFFSFLVSVLRICFQSAVIWFISCSPSLATDFILLLFLNTYPRLLIRFISQLCTVDQSFSITDGIPQLLFSASIANSRTRTN